MKKLFPAILLLAACSICAEEYFVDINAKDGGDGKSVPFKTIGSGIKALKPGDTLTIKPGTYREVLSIHTSGASDKPITIRGEAGGRTVISGFEPITGWTEIGNGVYKTRTPAEVKDLYVGLEQQQCGRWPDNGLMRWLVNPNAEEKSIGDKEKISGFPYLAEIAKEPANAIVFMYVRAPNAFAAAGLAKFELENSKIFLKTEKWNKGLGKKGGGDRYSIMNHPALVRLPGNWAFVKDADEKGGGTLYFMPKNKEDLEKTQYRKFTEQQIFISGNKNKKAYVSDVIIQNLEITGAGGVRTGNGAGIRIGFGKNITVENCLIYHNFSVGFTARNSENITVRNCVIMANGNGIGISSINKALFEGNEIALNLVDGFTIGGNTSGNPKGAPETFDVTVRRNYVHHHLLQAHPDNLQTFREVHNTVFDGNFIIWAGQSLMTEQTHTATFKNNVVFCCSANMLIFGHRSSDNWLIENNTLGLAGGSIFSFTDKDYRIFRNILHRGPLTTIDKNNPADYNLIFPKPGGSVVTGKEDLNGKKKFRNYASLADAVAATGQNKNSKVGDPKFKNVPAAIAISGYHEDNTTESLIFKTKLDQPFSAGDKIEINGDGIMREVVSASGDRVTFKPGLPGLPFRVAQIVNWKKSNSTVIDAGLEAGSPALKMGKAGRIGSDIDTVAFQNGDLLGAGKRTLPPMPDELKNSLPDPNNTIIPPYGR